MKKTFLILLALIVLATTAYLAFTRWVGLRVVAVSPASGSAASSRARIRITFDRPVEVGQLEAAFQIEPSIAGKWVIEGQTAWFTPDQAMKTGVTYRATLASGMRSSNNARLIGKYQWSFSIREAWVTYLSPAFGLHQLWRVPAKGGTPQMLSNVDGGVLEYSISPDGNQVVFSATNFEGGADLWSVDRDGKNQQALVGCGGELCRSPAWNPEGKALVYVRTEAPYAGTHPSGRLWLYDLQSGQTASIERAQPVTGSEPVWSPDGSRLAFYDPQLKALRILSWLGGTEVRIPSAEPGPVSFSPDGSQVAYLNPSLAGVIPYNSIVVYNFAERSTKTILGDGAEIADYSLPAWSPDGSELAVGFHSPAGNPAHELYLTKTDGTLLHKIASNPSQNFIAYSWDPGGEELLIQVSSLTDLKASPQIMAWSHTTQQLHTMADAGIWPSWLP